MEIINLNSDLYPVLSANISYAFNLVTLKEIWIFNCCEGCQHILGSKQIKINLISKIIITNLEISNLSGLMGLLSSLSLMNRKKGLHIYSYDNINKYLELSIKYSQTNFKYNIYFHILKTGLLINHNFYHIYAFKNKLKFEFFIIDKEKLGKFKLKKAKSFHIIAGPLYGKLKHGDSLIFPDGIILNGEHFTKNNLSGNKVLTKSHKYHKRDLVEISDQCNLTKSLF
uniref:Ribonuclease Z n=1 Tax=Leiomenia cribrosa TaxID=217483 RepID=A0A4D6X0R4_9FLOR|nr:ribonuclease Z [Leiomenia cribrosa]